jgi:citronellol/citronellal dehydrogenase
MERFRCAARAQRSPPRRAAGPGWGHNALPAGHVPAREEPAINDLSGKTLFITGASRGIGLAIARRAARDGANVAIAAKSAVANPRLPGTIHSAAAEVRAAGGRALALQCDIREEEQVRAAVAATVDAFGGIDILVNNASAIWLRGTLDTPMKRFDLMQQVNARGSFLCAQACLPQLLQAPNPHILTLAPPPSLDPKWWGAHTGYTLAKMGMSFVTLGLAAEFGPQGVAVDALWPRTVIATDAINMLPGVDPARCRTPEIVADAAHAILVGQARGAGGRFLIDEEVLRAAGVTDFSGYAVDPSQPLLPDLFLD